MYHAPIKMARKEECIWFDQLKHEQAATKYHSNLAENHAGLKVEGNKVISHNPISTEIEKAMSLIGKSLKSTSISNTTDLEERVAKLEIENSRLSSTVDSILKRLNELNGHTVVDDSIKAVTTTNAKEEEEDDFDLFGSDDEAEADQLRKERLEKYAEKKAAKPRIIAKSSVILDVKPWDDETDPSEIESKVRSVSADGLKWGGSKILPVAYGIKKLQIICVIEDDKIGTDFLEESITQFEDLVQSVDIVAFNKI